MIKAIESLPATLPSPLQMTAAAAAAKIVTLDLLAIRLKIKQH
jgi:hypothetical protein